MSDQIADITNRLSTTQEARNLLALLAAGPDMRKYLVDAFPTMAKDEQQVMVAMIGYRLMGAMLPLSIELLAHLPSTRALALQGEKKFQKLIERMMDKGLILIGDIDHKPADGTIAARLYSPQVEAVVNQALRDELGPQLVSVHGNALKR